MSSSQPKSTARCSQRGFFSSAEITFPHWESTRLVGRTIAPRRRSDASAGCRAQPQLLDACVLGRSLRARKTHQRRRFAGHDRGRHATGIQGCPCRIRYRPDDATHDDAAPSPREGRYPVAAIGTLAADHRKTGTRHPLEADERAPAGCLAAGSGRSQRRRARPPIPTFFRHRTELLPAANGFSALRAEYTSPLVVLMGLVALVLLGACATVANLLAGQGRRPPA